MTLWRLEILRLVRTRRLIAIVGVYLFFGFLGPLTARYISQILGALGTEGVRIEFPEPVPADGIDQFISNTTQIALLVVVMVAASALAFDARREMAVFLRTRVRGAGAIVIPAYVVTSLAALVGLTVGSLAAWYETSVLLGPLPPARMLAGIAFGAVFLAFAVAVVAFVAALVRGTLGAAGGALAALLALALLSSAPRLARWLPTHLATAMGGLARGTPVTGYLPALAVTAVLTVGLVTGAIALAGRREL